MDLKDLYRDVILDHNRSPRNFGRLDPADAHADGYNPLCGDRLTLYVKLDGERIAGSAFEGNGCAISVASASLHDRSASRARRAPKSQQLFRRSARAAHPARCARADAATLGKLAALVRRARIPGAREMREPLLAHAQRRARRSQRSPCTTE